MRKAARNQFELLYSASDDNHANQYNPNNHSYQDRYDNHANQLNPNNKEYRGGK